MRGKHWLAVLGVAVGLVVIAVGTVGLLSRHPAPAVAAAPKPPPLGQSAVPAPTGSLVTDPASPSAVPSPTEPAPGVLKSSYAVPSGQAGGQVALPVWLTIPALGIQKAPVIKLGLSNGSYPKSADLPKGSLDTAPLNDDPGEAGWYDLGARPGAIGPAIIAGHINYGGIEGVFADLPEMRAGELIYVGRADGSVVEFTVTKVETTPKPDFPTGGVYGSTGDPELRLITCSGDTVVNGHYLNNTIVYATEVT